MFDIYGAFKQLFGNKMGSAELRRRAQRFTRLVVERLEDRIVLAVWDWVGPVGGDQKWSNPNGQDWAINNVLQPANTYPGQAGNGDQVVFMDATAGPCTLDVLLPNSLNTLIFNGWNKTLTLDWTLTVAGGTGGFAMNDISTIDMENNSDLYLYNLGAQPTQANYWSTGTITAGPTSPNSALDVWGSDLTINSAPGSLGVNMDIQGTGAGAGPAPGVNPPATPRPGEVYLAGMTTNLTLSGTNNEFQVGQTGYLYLSQWIQRAGDANNEGGIVLGAGHTGTEAIFVQQGGTLRRNGTNTQGVPDQITVGGTIHNNGTVYLAYANMLKITGQDSNGVSFLQDSNVAGVLLNVDIGANINAVGTYSITDGTVQFNVPSAGGPTDALDGAGLIFGGSNPTYLTIVDFGKANGTITVQGPVTLGQNTTTTENFNGTNNTADLLDVKNGTLTLAGTLKLLGAGVAKPTKPLNFLDDSGAAPAINGNFAKITDNVNGTDTGKVVVNNPQLDYYQVTIK